MTLKNTCKIEVNLGNSKTGHCYSLHALAKATGENVMRLPVSLRIVLESLLRNSGGDLVGEDQVRELAHGNPTHRARRKCRLLWGAWY